MYSTLQYNRSVRESGVPFERIAYSEDGRHVMTIDPSSRRYWCEGKHAKAIHEKSVFYGPGKKALFLGHLPRYECFLSVVSHRNTKDMSLQIRTWDYNMRRTNEVRLGGKKYSICGMDPDRKYIVLCGSGILFLVIGKPPLIPGKATAAAAATAAMTDETEVVSTATEDPGFVVSEYQQLSIDDMRGEDLTAMTTMDFVSPSIVAMSSSSSCCLCIRLPQAPPPPTPGSRAASRSKRLRTPQIAPEMKGPFPFKCVRFENSAFVERPGCKVLSMKSVYKEAGIYFIVAYSDGKVFIYSSKSLAEIATALKKYDQSVNEETVAIIPSPQFVCSFEAYAETKATPMNSMSLFISEGISLLKEAFSFELFTMDRKGLVCHWGVSAISADVNCVLLGSYSMGIDRQREYSNADTTKNTLFPGSGTTDPKVVNGKDRAELMVVLPAWGTRPHRHMICSVGGQMCFLSVMQPQVVLMKRQPVPRNPLVLVGACMGAGHTNHTFRSTRLLTSELSAEYRGPEVLALEKESNVINSIAASDGTPLFEFSVQCPSDFTDSNEILQRIVPPKDSVVGKHCPIAYNNALIESTRSQQTVMSCAVYSPMTGATVVGYRSGALCAFFARNSVDSSTHSINEHYSSFRFNTKEVHGTPIMALRVVSRNDNAAEYLISADESGLIVVWNLAIGIMSSNPTCLWQSNAHVGSVVSVQVVVIPCRSEESKKFEQEGQAGGPPIKFFDHKIIVTACSAGIIKSWKLLDPGVLNAIGCVRTGGKPQLTSLLAIGFLREPNSPTPSPVPPPKMFTQQTATTSEDAETERERIEKATKPVLYPYDNGEVAGQKWIVPTTITAGVDFNIVCVCGRSTGLVDTWVLSNEPGMCSRDGCPVSIHQLHLAPVVALRQIPKIESSALSLNSAEDVLTEEEVCHVLSASKDGWQTILEADVLGEITVSNHIAIGNSSFDGTDGVKDVLLIATSDGEGKGYVDCLAVREEGISKYLLSSSSIPHEWNKSFSNYRQLQGTGKLSLRREYSLIPNEKPLNVDSSLAPMDIDESSVQSSKSKSEVRIPFYVAPMDDSRPVTGDPDKLLSSRTDSNACESKYTDHDALMTIDSMLPIPELNQDYTPEGSLLVSSPAESRLDPFSPSGLMQHSSVTEMSQMRFGSPNHKRTEKEKELINELQFAKKNRKLNESFRQSCIHKINSEPMVSLDMAIDLITEHTKSARSDVVNLGLLVGIDGVNGLDFLKVCKLVAILTYAHRQYGKNNETPVGNQKRMKKSFKDMRKTKTIVTYNAMGERVVQKEQVVSLGYLADGVYKGFMSEIQKIWSQQPPRVESVRELAADGSIHTSLVGEAYPAYLSGIPSTFRGIVNKRYTTIAEVWTSDLPHWFDVGRTVRIARTILDSRLMLQRDHLFSLELSPNILDEDALKPKLLSLQELTLQYFERNYGAAELNVSHSKVMHFVEACFQYSKFPVLQTLRKFLCPVEANFPFRETYVWFYIESRDFLFSGNCVIRSSSVLTLETSSIADSLSVDSSSSMTNVYWERIKRSDARQCALEMFEKRGAFGPSVTSALLELIETLPPAEFNGESDEEAHLLDLEYFLDAITMFLVQQVTELDRAKEAVLSPACLPRKTKSASIRLDKSKSSMSMDDIATVLHKLRRLCLCFMTADPLRTGLIPLPHFETTIKKEGGKALGIDNTKHFVGLLNSCKNHFTDTATNGVGYIDFIAVMVACVVQNHDASELLIEDFIEAANTVTRGIEDNQVEALLHFLGHEQCPYPGNNPLWTLSRGNITALVSRRLKSDGSVASTTGDPEYTGFDWKTGGLTLSTDGHWLPGTRTASDGPGLLTINKMSPERVENASAERSLGVDGSNWKNETGSTKLHDDPSIKNSGSYVPNTSRDITSVLGETRSRKPPKAPAVITPQDLSYSLSASELQHLQNHIQKGVVRNHSAPTIEANEPDDKSTFFGRLESQDSASKFGATVDSLPRSTKMVRVPEVKERAGHRSPDRHRPTSSTIHETMGTSTVFTELEGVSVTGGSSVSGRESHDQNTKSVILRRPTEEAVKDSTEGRYTAQGRATGPTIPNCHEVEQDIEYLQEEYRLSEYRKSKVHKVVAARLAAKMQQTQGDEILFCDSDTESLMSVNGFASLSQWHNISVHDMSVSRKRVIDEEEEAALEMQAERKKFYKSLYGKQDELMRAKKEARRKERETARIAAEQMALKDERKAKRKLEEAQRAAEAEAELLAREVEERARIAAERQRRADMAAANRAAEAEMLQKRIESDNLMAMRAEDARCRAVEEQEKERLRLAAEKEFAEKEAERKAHMQAVAKEQERQEQLEKQAANQQKLADMKLELENIKSMNKHDINVHKVYADAQAILEKQQSDLEEAKLKALQREEQQRLEAERAKTPMTADDDDDGDAETDTVLTAKIKKFLRVMEKTEDGTNLHPRRYDDDKKGRNFFMPMTFSDDIRFNPFTAPNYDRGWFQEQMLEDRKIRQGKYSEDEYNPTRDFSDITERVERIRQQQALDQTKMYSVTDNTEDPATVTKIFRNGAIDWAKYMARDKHMVEESKHVGTTYTEYRSDVSIGDLNPIVDNDSHKLRAANRPIYRPIKEVTSSKLPVFYRNGGIGVTQLPLGHVVHDRIGKDCYRYYQVNHPNKNSLLTVDLKCNAGQTTALLIWSPDKLPSIAACDEKADCTELNGYCCRISTAVPKTARSKVPIKQSFSEDAITSPTRAEPCVYKPIIAVHSPDENSEFTLWAVATTDAKVLPKPIERVSRLIEEFNVLTTHDSHDLSEHFSVYRRDARRLIDEEAAIRAESRQEIQNKIARSVLRPIVNDPLGRSESSFIPMDKEREISEELATMERFIARAGRLAIGNALRTTLLAPPGNKKSSRLPSPDDKYKPIHELVEIDDSDDESDEGNSVAVKTDGTPAHVVEKAFRGELDSFPMLYTRPTIADREKTSLKLPDPVISKKKRALRKELMFNPGTVSYQLNTSKSTGFLKGSSQQDTFV